MARSVPRQWEPRSNPGRLSNTKYQLCSNVESGVDMKAESFIGWIEMTADDLNRARDYLRRLEEGTQDELGFGIIRDFFSEEFFPATSTVMSIARQYVLVPFCCIHLERRILNEKWNLDRARREMYEMENHLRGCVSDIQKKDVQRLPSIIFWPALRKLRIFADDCSIYTYLRRLVEDSGRRYHDDDAASHAASDDICQWDPELLRLYEKEKDSLITDSRFHFEDPTDKLANGRMTRIEANYLLRVYTRHAEKKQSIMSHILQHGVAPAHSLPWDMDHPSELRTAVQDALRFSLLVGGARLIYFQLLMEERKNRGLPDFAEVPDYEECFSAWWEVAHSQLMGWEFDAFISRTQQALRPYRKDKQFLADFFDQAKGVSNARIFFNSAIVREMVRERERRVRPFKSRLRNPKYLEQWKPIGYDVTDLNSAYGLDFRGGIASRLCTEIINGLNGVKRNG